MVGKDAQGTDCLRIKSLERFSAAGVKMEVVAKATKAFVTPQQNHTLIPSMPCCTGAVIHTKGESTEL